MALKIALAIFRLQPAGGLEQHCLRLAAELAGRGAEVTIVTTCEPAARPSGVTIVTLPRRGLRNHARMAAFLKDATAFAATGYDRTVSFHPGRSFDFLFCGDVCRRTQWSGLWTALSFRRRGYLAMEAEAFAPQAKTMVLGLAQTQLDAFSQSYGTPSDRLVVLPPTVDRARAEPRERTHSAGVVQRWLWAGLAPRTKGLDRVLAALKQVPDAKLAISGCDPEKPRGLRARRQSRRLGVDDRVDWLGFISESAMSDLMARTEVLVHPARLDTTGTIILEALANGVPVVTTAVCGYAEHVERAEAGVVLPEPFVIEALVSALRDVTPHVLDSWSRRALAYTADPRFFSGVERAADIIEAGLRE